MTDAARASRNERTRSSSVAHLCMTLPRSGYIGARNRVTDYYRPSVQDDVLRLRALAAELEAVRAQLGEIRQSRARTAVRVRRAAGMVALAVVFAAGVSLGVGPSLGASPAPAACGSVHTTQQRAVHGAAPTVTIECSGRRRPRGLLGRASFDSVSGQIKLISPPPGVLF